MGKKSFFAHHISSSHTHSSRFLQCNCSFREQSYGLFAHTMLGVPAYGPVHSAFALILPLVTHILPWLTLAAAIGLVCTMVGAIIVYVRLNETKTIGAPVVLLLLSLFIVYGSFAVLGVA